MDTNEREFLIRFVDLIGQAAYPTDAALFEPLRVNHGNTGSPTFRPTEDHTDGHKKLFLTLLICINFSCVCPEYPYSENYT